MTKTATADAVTLQANLRDKVGTGPARALRRAGLIPAIIYGSTTEPISISVQEKEITKLYRRPGFTSTRMTISINGKEYPVLAKAIDLHPITELARHVDFVLIPKKGMQKVNVPIIFEGKERCLGVKRGGYFNIIHRKIEINCPVDNILRSIAVDVINMPVGASIKATTIALPENCTLVKKGEFVVASITGRSSKASAEDDAKTDA